MRRIEGGRNSYLDYNTNSTPTFSCPSLFFFFCIGFLTSNTKSIHNAFQNWNYNKVSINGTLCINYYECLQRILHNTYHTFAYQNIVDNNVTWMGNFNPKKRKLEVRKQKANLFYDEYVIFNVSFWRRYFQHIILLKKELYILHWSIFSNVVLF
jgi:hypothetical protein